MKSFEEKIEQLAELILDSKNIVALTGAGMSTESGIADFRTPGIGIYSCSRNVYEDIYNLENFKQKYEMTYL